MTNSRMDEVAARKSRSESVMFAATKNSHIISKSYSAAKDESKSSQYSQNKNIITPSIRVVYVYEPEIIKTDPQNFRSLVQRLTGKPTNKSKEKKRHTNPCKSSSSEVISAEAGTEKLEDDTFYSNYQLPAGENTSRNSSAGNWFSHNGFNDTEMIFSGLGYQGLLHEIPLVTNNSPFCNMYDQPGVYRCT